MKSEDVVQSLSNMGPDGVCSFPHTNQNIDQSCERLDSRLKCLTQRLITFKMCVACLLRALPFPSAPLKWLQSFKVLLTARLIACALVVIVQMHIVNLDMISQEFARHVFILVYILSLIGVEKPGTLSSLAGFGLDYHFCNFRQSCRANYVSNFLRFSSAFGLLQCQLSQPKSMDIMF